jgi:predicted DNA-binding WGR domain protein
MGSYYLDSSGVFYFIATDDTKVLRAIGRDAARAYKNERDFPSAAEAEAFARACREGMAARGFQEKDGTPGFDLSQLLDWSNLVKDYTRYFESPAGDEFWYADTRRDPTHNLLAIGRGAVGLSGTSTASCFGKDNDETVAEIERLCALMSESGYIEKPVPEALVEWTIHGSLSGGGGAPRAPKPMGGERLREIGRMLSPEYRDAQQGKALPEVLPAWPACLGLLEPFMGEASSEPPRIIADLIEREAPEGFEGLPIKIEAVLGRCPLWSYPRCPNLPEHHVPDFTLDEDISEGEFREIGRERAFPYIWSDLALTDAKGKEYRIRMVFNRGDPDVNDGYWGTAWDLGNRRRVADISSTGDMETAIEVRRDFAKAWKEGDGWLPDEFEPGESDPALAGGVAYKTGHELERILRLAMMMVDELVG